MNYCFRKNNRPLRIHPATTKLCKIALESMLVSPTHPYTAVNFSFETIKKQIQHRFTIPLPRHVAGGHNLAPFFLPRINFGIPFFSMVTEHQQSSKQCSKNAPTNTARIISTKSDQRRLPKASKIKWPIFFRATKRVQSVLVYLMSFHSMLVTKRRRK